MTPKFPCGICSKAVEKNRNAVCCDGCNLWVHIRCNNLNFVIEKCRLVKNLGTAKIV